MSELMIEMLPPVVMFKGLFDGHMDVQRMDHVPANEIGLAHIVWAEGPIPVLQFSMLYASHLIRAKLALYPLHASLSILSFPNPE